ncbi:MAG TPA: ABC transporter substrate-binding protein [Gammaproteobacteria bacterium]|nr:ABC transporter substrate-binding protein [Gammaproteobacteria bacterium]
MDKRFTSKDFVYFSIFGVIILLLVLAMYMVDRQWLKLSEMERVMDEQAQDLRQLRRAIGSGGVTRAPEAGAQPAGEVPAAFRRAAAAAAQPDYAEGDWLVRSFSSALKTVTPLVTQDLYGSIVQDYVLESLLIRDPDSLEWNGLLAKDWTVSDDGLVFTFHLREEARFSDAKPVTADDVVFTFDFIMTPAIQAPRDRALMGARIASVEAKGPHTVVFTFKEPYFNALSMAGEMRILARHFYAPYLKTPQKFNQSKGLLFGSGPYRLKDPKGWTPDRGFMELERNPRYWGPVVPPFDRLIWKFIENASARLISFRNGELDMYGARPVEYKKLIKDAKLMARAQNWEYMNPVQGYSYIAWNQQREGRPTRFADVRVRRAMTLLTDIKTIISEISLGYAEPTVSPFSNRSPQHDPQLKPWQTDVAHARALLAEAGFVDRNGDGVLEDASGVPFEFELTYSQGREDTERMVLLLKDMYAQAGILLKPKPTEWAVMLDALNTRDFDAITLGWTSGVEVDIYQMFHSSQIENQGENFMHYANPELDRLIDEARRTVDEAKRMKLWHRAERILYEDQPYTFLTRGKSLVFIDRRIRNVAVTRLGLNSTLVPMEIYVPRAEQRYRN